MLNRLLPQCSRATVVENPPMMAAHHMRIPTSGGSPAAAWRNLLQRRGGNAAAARKTTVAHAAPRDPIVSTAWLAENLEEVSILDVRGRVDTATLSPGFEKSTYIAGRDEYLEGHIPGAVFFDWTKDGIDTAAGAPVQLETNEDVFHAMLESKGVSADRPVVVYDSGDGMFAARLWWALLCHGHPDVRILEGGYGRWVAEGRPQELYEPCPLKLQTTFDADLASPRPEVRATAEEVLALLPSTPPNSTTTTSSTGSSSNSSTGLPPLIVDTRNQEQFEATVRRGPRGGRIPGAISLPRRLLIDDTTGWLLPLEQQRRVIIDKLGLTEAELAGSSSRSGTGSGGSPSRKRRIVLYCNGGVAACTAALALHRLGAAVEWQVYDGSWNEWGQREELPVELPPGAPGSGIAT